MKASENDSYVVAAKTDDKISISWDKKQMPSYKCCATEDKLMNGSLNKNKEVSSGSLNKKDEGYAWLIVVCSFMVHFFIGGIILTTGVTFVMFLDVFKASSGVTAWVGSLPRASYNFIAPITSVLTNKFGSRPVVILGGLISAIGLGTSAFASSLYHLYITYGIIAGVGLGLAYVPATTIINDYFDRKKTLAFGIATSGYGVGAFIYPTLIEALNARYGWRGVMLILSAIGLNMCICGALMRPFRKIKVMETKTAFNFRILKSLNFSILCLNSIVYHFGLSIILTHLSEYSLLMGIGSLESSMLFSVLGVTNIVGLLMFGAIAQHPKASPMVLFIAGRLITGIATVFVPLFTQYGPLLVYSGTVGVFSATVTVLSPVIVCQMLGPNELSCGYGALLPSSAIGLLLGGPVAGFMYDSIHSYNSSFFVGGGMIIASGLCMVIPYLRRNHNYSEDANEVVTEKLQPLVEDEVKT